MRLNSEARYVFSNICKFCDEQALSISIFDLSFVGDDGTLEVYTAQEHDEWAYCGDMGIVSKDLDDLENFIKSVKAQIIYRKTKEGIL